MIQLEEVTKRFPGGQEALSGLSLSVGKVQMVFVTGHPEYDPDTLQQEYVRDLKAGLNPAVPINYFPHDNPDAASRLVGLFSHSC